MMMASPSALVDGSLEDRAHQALVEWLTEEHPSPGQPVPIREFARRLNMSRTPVRSAVGRLYERGLLAYDSVAGFTVAVPSLSSLYELFELRLMIESHSVRRYCERAIEEPADVLQELIDGGLGELGLLVDQILQHVRRLLDGTLAIAAHAVRLDHQPELEQLVQ